MKKNYWITLFMVGGILISSCSSDDDNPVAVNEEEVITTLTVTLTPVGDGEVITLQSRDLDGDGPNPPVITVSGSLSGNTTYNGSIVLLNETVSPPEDITEEVAEEADEHQFFFTTTGPIESINATDTDANGNPVGINFELTTFTAGPATIAITLRHEPKKPNDGTLADAGGETDIAQTFSVLVQ
ncbi:type 1 periplasmic binding fold superfamily protein [Arenibacter sp. GZD96]|uniref:hypothetical protein n=1 Tax=Aurantibrevibacter litoralis TaxID=3106030 RepID=UPI002AFF1823|nr:hypothetical protein [Arenibacter sp. GZD-96]MEA1786367.1 type 1 periplasmic binding fold superfamily protein [Arenibacter sp. GZD-96]